MGRIDRHRERHVAGPLHPPDDLRSPLEVAAHVELEDLGRWGRGGGLLELDLRARAHRVHDPKLGGGAGRSLGAFRVEEVQPTDRREDGWDAQLLAQEGGGRIDLGHVDQDARPEGDPIEGGAIPAERRFRLGTAGNVVPGTLVQAASRFLDDLLVADKITSHGSPPPLSRLSPSVQTLW